MKQIQTMFYNYMNTPFFPPSAASSIFYCTLLNHHKIKKPNTFIYQFKEMKFKFANDSLSSLMMEKTSHIQYKFVGIETACIRGYSICSTTRTFSTSLPLIKLNMLYSLEIEDTIYSWEASSNNQKTRWWLNIHALSGP